jgi:hypothetical protein
MRKLIKIIFLYLILYLSSGINYAQDIEVIRGDTVKTGSPGSEMIFYIQVVNVSFVNQTIFLIRTENNLPQNWTSSLCFDGLCFPPYLDSVYTNEPVKPGDSVEASVYFFTDSINPETAHIQIQVSTMAHPNIKTTVNLTASTLSVTVKDPLNITNEFRLMQNFPNPFNPSTSIEYRVGSTKYVTFKIYDVLGNEVATLVNEEKPAGSYEVNWNAEGLSSGIYFYQLKAMPNGGQTGKFVNTKKLVIIK